ncbi:MAG TPA: outer membrane beta-barrel protein [Chitinophagaceae bacterium]|jgi:hypothetical protein
MPTHDFEKQVQQKMDELKFVPSEAVWEEVAKQIRERRDRRRLLVWWLLFPLLAGGSFGIYITNKHIASAAKPGKPTHAMATTITKAPASSSPGNHEAGGTVPVVINQQNIPDSNNLFQVARNGYIAGIRRKLPTGDKTGLTNETVVVAGINLVAEPVPTSVNMDAMKPARVSPLPAGDYAFVIEASPADPSSLKPLLAVLAAKADSAEAVKKPAQHEKKMEWVLTAHTGGAGISSGFSLPRTSPAAYDNAFTGSSLSNITYPGTTQAAVRPPSGIKPGLAFTASLSARRFLGGGFSLEAGVQYSYYSTSLQAGTIVDSSATVRQGAQRVSSYYKNSGVENKYSNQYHFIEVPLRAQLQLGHRSPFSFNTGLSIGRFIGSNALQYDAPDNIYYKDNTLFNKTQLNMSAGFDIRFLQNKPLSFEAGPRLQYGVTRLFKQEIYGDRHLLFAGLEMRMFFGKR